ncbi:hypothetical protein SAMN02799624_05409 [Paenibacillus sp. UNC496MF]|uniref:hypothetical protein n=1 Tax=Paenibacillus sp. UNC496MF TaxID=1502753 RepID=UPI0008EEA9A6|nr:hypothetical protein [Paenibacillus sp. UNC496MF]SFJ65653.1 hypothetical protein SAMN02799624_05409 [Paenibacillus sp. UNC496MF]
MSKKLKSILQYLTVTPGILILVLELVKAFEVDGNGDAKKQAVLDSVAGAYDELAKVMTMEVSKEYVMAIAERCIDIAVKFYNLVGIFKSAEAKA